MKKDRHRVKFGRLNCIHWMGAGISISPHQMVKTGTIVLGFFSLTVKTRSVPTLCMDRFIPVMTLG